MIASRCRICPIHCDSGFKFGFIQKRDVFVVHTHTICSIVADCRRPRFLPRIAKDHFSNDSGKNVEENFMLNCSCRMQPFAG